MRILIAEDDLISRKFMEKVLCCFGKCALVTDGLEAVRTFTEALNGEEQIDLICMDIMMPRIDGLRALKIIRELEQNKGVDPDKRVKVIMTTALNDRRTVETSYNAGCEAYLWKPIEVSQLVETVNQLGFTNYV